jgi:surface polysaccharide O-acyltransferase-like enzyme
VLNRLFQQRKHHTIREEKTLDSKMLEKALGTLLIIIAIILAAIQHFGGYNLYGDPGNKWYFYGLIIIIGIIGVILIAWGYMKSSSSKKPA